MIFEELMRCHPDNQSVYDDLLEQVKKYNVTPFVGAGLTTWAGFPQWKGLLTDMAAGISPAFREEIQTLLDGSDLDRYETAASRVQDELATLVFHRKLRAAFSDEELKNRAADRPAYQSLLPKLFPNIWVTTNFDRGIEHLFSRKLDAVTPLDEYHQDRIERALHNQEPLLLKLHGDIQDTNNLVLTKESYDKAYADGQPMPKMLRDVFARGPMLFLGCSLEQDRTMEVLSQCSENAEQFAVLKLPSETVNEDDIFAPQLFDADGNEKPAWRNRRLSLSRKRISCIWYPAVPKDYAGNIRDEALAALFRQLAADMGIAESAAELPDIRNAEFLSEIFLFRDDEKKTVSEAIRTPGGRCAVTGEPGVGKTELCLRVREDGSFPKKQFLFVRTEGAENLLMLFSDVAEALSEKLPEGTGYEATGEWLLGLLKEKAVKALYLDNFEDILAALQEDDKTEERAFLWRWLNAVKEEKISCLLSSRELPPTTVCPCKEVPLKGFTPEQSREVFLQYLGREPKDSEKAAFEALLTALDGHPLAIALTAAQAQSELSLNDLLDCWQEVRQEMPDKRHSSLKTALSVTWKRLGEVPGARTLWGVFAFGSGRVSRETLDWLYEGRKEEQKEAARACFAAGILKANEARTGWEMSVPIKEQFFLLAEDGEKEAAVMRWLDRLIPLLKDAGIDSDPEHQLPAYLRVLALLPDCLSILEHLLRYLPRKPMIEKLDGEMLNYYPRDGARDVVVLRKLESFYRSESDDLYLAYALQGQGIAAWNLNDPAADTFFKDAETCFRNIRNNEGLAQTLYLHALLAISKGALFEARDLLIESQNLPYRHNQYMLAHTFLLQGFLAPILPGNMPPDDYIQQAEDIFSNINNQFGVQGLVSTQVTKGRLEVVRGNFMGAKLSFHKALKNAEKIHDHSAIAGILKLQGDLTKAQGDDSADHQQSKAFYQEAEGFYREAAKEYEQIEESDSLATTYVKLFTCYQVMKKRKKAAEYRQKAEALLPLLPDNIAAEVKETLGIQD